MHWNIVSDTSTSAFTFSTNKLSLTFVTTQDSPESKGYNGPIYL